jgi:hypothetical protein
MSEARSTRYRRLALAEPDVESARLLRLLADEADRGVLCTVEPSRHDIPIARMTRTIPRRTVVDERIGGPPLTEAKHFWKCEACGGWYDTRDLGAVLDHEKPLPHPASDQAQ